MNSWHDERDNTQCSRKVSLRLSAFVLASIALHSSLLLLEHHRVIEFAAERSMAIHLVERQQPLHGQETHPAAQPAKPAARQNQTAKPRPSPKPARTRPAPAQSPAAMDKPGAQHRGETKIAVDEAAARSPTIDDAALQASLKGTLQQELARHFTYPLLARRRGWQGEVLLAFRLEADGRITDARVARSSGYGVLDRAALTALGKIKRIRSGIPYGIAMQLPVIYRLEG